MKNAHCNMFADDFLSTVVKSGGCVNVLEPHRVERKEISPEVDN